MLSTLRARSWTMTLSTLLDSLAGNGALLGLDSLAYQGALFVCGYAIGQFGGVISCA